MSEVATRTTLCENESLLTDVLIKFAVGVLAFSMALLTSVIPFFLQKWRFKNGIGFANAFIAGMFLSIGVIHMLPEAKSSMGKVFSEANNERFRPAFLLLLVGYIITLTLQRVALNAPTTQISVRNYRDEGERHRKTQRQLKWFRKKWSPLPCQKFNCSRRSHSFSTRIKRSHSAIIMKPENPIRQSSDNLFDESYPLINSTQVQKENAFESFQPASDDKRNSNEIPNNLPAISPYGGVSYKEAFDSSYSLESSPYRSVTNQPLANKRKSSKPHHHHKHIALDSTHLYSESNAHNLLHDDINKSDINNMNSHSHGMLSPDVSYANALQRTLILLAVLSVHAALEGAVVGVQCDINSIIFLSLAVLGHKWAESFALGSHLCNVQKIRQKDDFLHDDLLDEPLGSDEMDWPHGSEGQSNIETLNPLDVGNSSIFTKLQEQQKTHISVAAWMAQNQSGNQQSKHRGSATSEVSMDRSSCFSVHIPGNVELDKISIIVLTVFALSCPLGLILGILTRQLLPPLASAALLAISSGTFIYIGATEVIVEEFSWGMRHWKKWWCLIGGVLLVYLVTIFEEEEI